MERKCLKCGVTNPSATGADLEACPSCGAIYSKVEALWGNKQTEIRREALNRIGSKDDFLGDLRDSTAYPVYRTWTRFTFIVMMVLSVVVVISGILAFFAEGFLSGFFRVFGGVLIAVFARLLSEFALMLADMSDATIRTAYNTQKHSE
jgi:ABC-type multidrug transport system permease subunit